MSFQNAVHSSAMWSESNKKPNINSAMRIFLFLKVKQNKKVAVQQPSLKGIGDLTLIVITVHVLTHNQKIINQHTVSVLPLQYLPPLALSCIGRKE